MATLIPTVNSMQAATRRRLEALLRHYLAPLNWKLTYRLTEEANVLVIRYSILNIGQRLADRVRTLRKVLGWVYDSGLSITISGRGLFRTISVYVDTAELPEFLGRAGATSAIRGNPECIKYLHGITAFDPKGQMVRGVYAGDYHGGTVETICLAVTQDEVIEVARATVIAQDPVMHYSFRDWVSEQEEDWRVHRPALTPIAEV